MNSEVVVRRSGGGYVLTQEESDRIRILKVWLAIMVVFIHSYKGEFTFQGNEVAMETVPWVDWTKYIISKVISDCAVPGYFFLSAVFLFRKPFRWRDNVKKKLRTILLPYLILNTVWICFYFAAQHISFLDRYFADPGNFIAGWSWREWVRAYTLAPFVYPLWFMRDLMILNLLAPVLKKLLDRVPVIMALAMVVTAAFSHLNNSHLLLHRFAFASFCLGYLAVKYGRHITEVDKIPVLPLTGVYAAAICLAGLARDSKLLPAADALVVVIGLLFFTRCATKITDPVWRDRLIRASKYGVPVYLFHERTLAIMKKLMAKFLPVTPVSNILQYFGAVFVVIALCVTAAKIMERFTPRLYSVLTGGR